MNFGDVLHRSLDDAVNYRLLEWVIEYRPWKNPTLLEPRCGGEIKLGGEGFRDTLAVDMLSRGASPYDVAKMLGDTIDTVERHYTPFVKELRDRVRNILEIGVGIEETVKTPPEPRQNAEKKLN